MIGAIVIGLVFLLGACTLALLWWLRNRQVDKKAGQGRRTGDDVGGGDPPAAKPASRFRTNAKKLGAFLWGALKLLALVVLIVLVVKWFWPDSLPWIQANAPPLAESNAQCLAGRKAVISWALPSGQQSRGRSEDPGLPAVVVYDDENRMEVEYSYKYDGRDYTGRLEMKKDGNKLVGPWHQRVPFDKGQVSLSNTTEFLVWEGNQTSVVENKEVRFKLIVR